MLTSGKYWTLIDSLIGQIKIDRTGVITGVGASGSFNSFVGDYMHYSTLQLDFLIITLVGVLLLSAAHAQSETLIPRSVSGDKGKYYLLESKKTGNVVRAVHKRVGVDSSGFTRTETNCRTGQTRELGYGEGSTENIKGTPTHWFDLVPGSSKSDLAHFVCKW